MRWDLDQLRQFIATADSGSISAAARALGKAQSAVSTAIALLEADLGVMLFDRSGHRARPTDAGRVLLREARELLRQASELDQRALALAAGGDARLALALDEALPYMAISALVRELSDRFPHLELTLLNGTAAEVVDYVDGRRADMAFHFDRGPAYAHFDQRRIGAVPQGVFVSSGHPLLEAEPAGRKELARHRQILMHADDAPEQAYSPRVWRSDSFYSIADMASDGLGWAILPVNIAREESYPKSLRQLECPSLTLPPLPVRVLWRRGSRPGPAAQWVETRFTELLRSAG